ncbi:MAG: hypothetical protein HZB63_01180, partial [Deltaproteobacteria bacterium]|nr:hypothetical protein [Deltaproteobacteria bacterium]
MGVGLLFPGQPDDGGHRSFAHLHRLLHVPAPGAQHAGGVAHRENPRGDERRVF